MSASWLRRESGLIGKEALWRPPSYFPMEIGVRVEIWDVRESFGRVEVQIIPLAGEGETWVGLNQLKVEKSGQS